MHLRKIFVRFALKGDLSEAYDQRSRLEKVVLFLNSELQIFKLYDEPIIKKQIVIPSSFL